MRQVVRAFLQNDDAKFLLVKHHKSQNWTLPGGHMEKAENIYEALKREIKEEFNLEIEIKGKNLGVKINNINELNLPISIYEIEFVSKKYGLVKNLEYIFLSQITGGKIKIQEDEIADYKYFSKEEILKLDNTFEQIKDIIKNIGF